MELLLLQDSFKVGETMIFDCRFLNKRTSEIETIRMLFDTGAVCTGICRSVLMATGHTNFTPGKVKKQTAKIGRASCRERV